MTMHHRPMHPGLSEPGDYELADDFGPREDVMTDHPPTDSNRRLLAALDLRVAARRYASLRFALTEAQLDRNVTALDQRRRALEAAAIAYCASHGHPAPTTREEG
jgi:hypothetical protein